MRKPRDANCVILTRAAKWRTFTLQIRDGRLDVKVVGLSEPRLAGLAWLLLPRVRMAVLRAIDEITQGLPTVREPIKGDAK